MNLEQSNFRQLFRGEIVKLTFSAAILFGLAVAMFQATPALSQTKPGSIFKVVATRMRTKEIMPLLRHRRLRRRIFGRSESRPSTLMARSGRHFRHPSLMAWKIF